MPTLPLDYSRTTAPRRTSALTILALTAHLLAAAGLIALVIALKLQLPIPRPERLGLYCILTALVGMILLILTLILYPADKLEYVTIAVDVLFWLVTVLA